MAFDARVPLAHIWCQLMIFYAVSALLSKRGGEYTDF